MSDPAEAPDVTRPVGPDMIDPGQIDTDLIERDLRDVEIALAALEDGTYWTADAAPDAPARAMGDLS